jgi:hypothetical protein
MKPILVALKHRLTGEPFGLGLTPVQITLGLLLIGSLSLAIVVLGMMTTVVRSVSQQ